MIHLRGKVGKRMEENKFSREIAISPACMSINSKGIWFINAMLPIIYFYDFKKAQVSWYKVIPECKKKGIFLFLGIYEYNDKLFLIPNNAKEIVIYNKREDSFSKIEMNGTVDGLFRGCVCVNDILYCIPYKHSRMIGIDITTCKVIYEIEWKEKNGLASDKYINSYAIGGDWLFAVVPRTNIILKYNFMNHEWDSFRIGDHSNSYATIGFLNNKVYFFELKNRVIYSCKPDEKIISNSAQINSDGIKIITGANYFVVDNIFDNKWFLLDETLNIIEKDEYVYRNIRQEFASSYYFACWGKKRNGNLICIDNYNHIIEIDTLGNKKQKLLYTNNILLEKSIFRNEEINGKGLYNENGAYSLQLFLEKVKENIK